MPSLSMKINIHPVKFDRVLANIKKWDIADEDKKALLEFCRDLGLGKINRGRRLLEKGQIPYLYSLQVSLTFFKKPSSKLTVKDVEDFDQALNSGKLKSKKKKNYSMGTQSQLKIHLSSYLRWKLGKTKGIELAGWLDKRVPSKSIEYLKEEEIIRLYKGCKDAKSRFMIAVLFDSGARAEELHNIRKEDIEFPTGSNNFIKLNLKEEYSKTEGRVISLYWKYSLEAVRDYYDERKNIKPDEPILTKKYDTNKKFLIRLGKRILKKNIGFHLFRHSSATFLATQLNRQELCYRFGWKFSSNMPDVYISRSGMLSKELDKKFVVTELEEIRLKLEKELREIKMKSERQEKNEEKSQKEIDNLRTTMFRFFKKEITYDKETNEFFEFSGKKKGLVKIPMEL